MNRSTAAYVAFTCIAAHSLLLGFLMLFFPASVMSIVGWEITGSPFFPSQSGLFLMILGGAYLGAIWSRSFAWLIIASKVSAVLFLIGWHVTGMAPKLVLPVAVGDGLMGLTVIALVKTYEPLKQVGRRRQSIPE